MKDVKEKRAMDNTRDNADVTGEELQQKTQQASHAAHQHGESLINKVIDFGNEAGRKVGDALTHGVHNVADVPHALGQDVEQGSQHLSGGIHNAVVNEGHKAGQGIGGLLHHDHPAHAADPHTAGTHPAGPPSQSMSANPMPPSDEETTV